MLCPLATTSTSLHRTAHSITWVHLGLADAMFTIPLYTVVLAALYQGGLLLLVAAMPVAFMVAVACLLIWLVLVKRYVNMLYKA